MGDTAMFVSSPYGETPVRITANDIKRWHLMSFPRLADKENELLVEEAIESIYTMFTGIGTLFDKQPKQIWFDKTQLLYRLLVCWYLADQYPLLVAGVPVMGGIPLKAKKVGGIQILFQDTQATSKKDYQDLLSGLKSNPWGHKAYIMIRGATKMLRIGGGRR